MIKVKIADAFVEIRGDKGKFSKMIRGAKSETAGFAKSAVKSLKRITTGFGLLKIAAVAAAIAISVKLTRAIISAGKATIQAAVKYDKLKRGLAAVAGGTEEARIQLERLVKVAELPGLSFEKAIQGSINLQAAGISAGLAERALKAFGNALVTVGKGADDLSGVNLALTQMANKTSGFGQDVRQLQERLPQMQTALKNAFDGKPLEDLEITGKELVAALVTEFEKLPTAAGGVANSIENLGIAFDRLKGEIGNTMLSITSDTADSLTGIIDTIREIIPHWKTYQDITAQVFTNIAMIGIKMTGAMMVSISKIIAAAAEVMWIPIRDGFRLMWIDLWNKDLGLVFGSEIPVIQKALDKLNKPFADWRKKTRESIADPAGKDAIKKGMVVDLQAAIDAMVAISLAELPKLKATWMEGLADISLELDKFGVRVPKTVEGVVKKTVAAFEKIAPGEVDFLKLKTEDPKKEVDRRIESIKRIADFRKQIMDEMGARGEINLEKFRGFMRQQEEAAKAVADAIRPIFENMFQDLFSGNTKNLWQAFWIDLKRIAIRQMATIFATQILTGLLTGGTSFAGMGLGTALSALAPKSIDPTSRAIGGAIRGGARAVGGFLEGGTINVYEQDLRNFDQQKMTKTVEQEMGPALAVAAADGIGS